MSAKRDRIFKRQLLGEQGWRCAYCGEPIEFEDATIDHVVARARGGADTWENKVAACRDCNNRKSAWEAAGKGSDYGNFHLTRRMRRHKPRLGIMAGALEKAGYGQWLIDRMVIAYEIATLEEERGQGETRGDTSGQSGKVDVTGLQSAEDAVGLE